MDKVAGAKALEGCETKCNSRRPLSSMKEAFKGLAVKLPSGKLLDVVQTVLTTQRSCIDLFQKVHQLDGDLQSASVRESNS